MLKTLFESLDEKVFTSELKESLETKFNEAVELKALEIAATKIEEKTVELEEKAEEFQAILEKEMHEKEAELVDQIDAYLEKVVEDFIAEAKESLDESIKSEKADMIIEAMEAMIVSTGVNIAKIVEDKDSTDPENKLGTLTAKYDSAIEENIKLEKENAKLLKMGVIAELKEGMNVIEAEKFSKLADLVEFENSKSYLTKLDTIRESVMTSKASKVEDVVEKEETKIIAEKSEAEKKSDITLSFTHLL